MVFDSTTDVDVDGPATYIPAVLGRNNYVCYGGARELLGKFKLVS